MIVKDEAKSLEGCLKSIRPYVDEIIIVDTGSKDGTDRIAEKYTEQLYYHPWEDNFSKARNYSLSYAVGDWILIIDADEELLPDDGACLKDTLSSVEPSVDHLFFTTRNLTREGGIMSECTNIRMFRNGQGIHYQGIVHNQAVPKGEGRVLPVTLLHYGYALSPEQMEAKHKKTLSLTLRQIEEEPDNPNYHHNLCLSLVNHGDCGKAVTAGEKALSLMHKQFTQPYPQVYYNLIYLLAKAALDNRQNSLAVSVSLEGLETKKDHIDVLWILAMAYYREKQFEKSVEYGEQYREAIRRYRMDAAHSIPTNTMGQIAPLFATMGYSASHIGRHDKALSFFEESLHEARWASDFGVKILHFCREHNFLESGTALFSGLMKHNLNDPLLLPFSQHFANIPPQAGRERKAHLLREFASDQTIYPYLEQSYKEGNISLKEIRRRIEDEGGGLDQARSLLLTLEALQREAKGDRSW